MTSVRDLGFDWHGESIAGTLHVPAGSGPHPATAMLAGSGIADRDGEWFEPLRTEFLARGIAVFSWDKPGCGESTGDWRTDTIARRVDRAWHALDALGRQPEVDVDRIGVWGHSQGGWVVQVLAASTAIAFAISNSGPTIGPAAQHLYDVEHGLRDVGVDETTIAGIVADVQSLHDAAAAGSTWKDALASLGPGDKDVRIRYLPIDADDADADFGSLARYIVEAYDPLAALASVKAPFLATFGGRDLLLPAARCAEEATRTLAAAPSTTTEVLVFPDGDHRLSPPESATPLAQWLTHTADWAHNQIWLTTR